MGIIRRLLTLVLLSLVPLPCHAVVNQYSLRLTAFPQAIVADSHSFTTVSAEVRDSSGGAVPDGTLVEFTASLGIIERRARTTVGVARARLESGNTTGTAAVSAVVAEANAVAELRVDFLAPGTEMFDESYISISSDKHLGYDVNSKIVDSAGGVTIYHRGLTIDAEEAQIDVNKNILRAKARMAGKNIVLKRGERQVTASVLYYDFSAMRGVIICPAEEGAARMLLRGRDLQVEPDKDSDESIKFDFTPISESKLFIRAKTILIRPGVELKFKRANYYLEGDKVLSIPLQVVPLRDQSGGVSQMLNYGSEGLRANLPIYYSLSPSRTGAIRLKHSEPMGWGSYSDRAGWQVDVDQEYDVRGSTQGLFSLNRVNSRYWGARWNHRVEFANDARIYTYLDFPEHRDLYGTVDYSKSLGSYTWSANLRGDKRRNIDGGYALGTFLQSRARPLIGDAVSSAFSTRLTYDNRVYNSRDRLGTGLGLQLYGKPIQFGMGASLSTSFTVSRDWGGASPGTSIYANAGLYRMLGNLGSAGLNYSYSWADAAYGYTAQRISGNLYLRPSTRWSANLYSTYGLGDHTSSAFGDLSYMFLPTWRLGLIGTYQKFAYANYTDAEIALYKALGRQEAILTWSRSRRKFRVEFSALSF